MAQQARFEEGESTNHHQVGRYRTPLQPLKPGSKFESTLANSEPNWEMRIKSVIFTPLDATKLSAGKVEIRGVAWNDGQTKRRRPPIPLPLFAAARQLATRCYGVDKKVPNRSLTALLPNCVFPKPGSAPAARAWAWYSGSWRGASLGAIGTRATA